MHPTYHYPACTRKLPAQLGSNAYSDNVLIDIMSTRRRVADRISQAGNVRMQMAALALVGALVFVGGALPSSEAASQPSTQQKMIADQAKGIGLDASLEAAERLGEMAEANNCGNPDSDWCQIAKNNNRIVGYAFDLLGIIVLIAAMAAIAGVVMFIAYLVKESGIFDSIHL